MCSVPLANILRCATITRTSLASSFCLAFSPIQMCDMSIRSLCKPLVANYSMVYDCEHIDRFAIRGWRFGPQIVTISRLFS